MKLTKKSETSTKITFTYDKPMGPVEGYLYYADNVRVSRTFNPNDLEVTFGKVASGQYAVEAVGFDTLDRAVWPQTPIPPTGDKLLGIVPGGGFPSTANGGNLAKSIGPECIREDHLSSELVAWGEANNSLVLGLGGPLNMSRVDQYPTIDWWEYDNEPYFRGVDLPAWARGARDFGVAFKAKHPNKKLILTVNTSTNGGDYQTGGTWSPWVDQVWNAAPDIGQYYDGTAGHPYSNPRDAPPQFALTDKVHGQLLAKGFDKPHFITEFGWSVGTATGPKGQVTLAEQAQFLNDFVTQARTRAWIAHIYVYCLRSWGTDFEPSFGLFNPDGTERPAATTFRNLVG